MSHRSNHLYLSGDYMAVFSFHCDSRAVDWEKEWREIKAVIAVINDGSTDEDEKVIQYGAWLRQVYAFRNKWSPFFVPKDIQDACNGVERGLGWQETVWPEAKVYVEE